jgi:ubiquinone/menaquinone biosynthesis C-methylase UbiE
MATPPDASERAATTYNAAADRYDDPSNTFWERFGRRTIERLRLQPSQRVLDVCCGTGASALAAAEAVGPNGSVLGVDLAGNLLALARAKAQARGLRNVEFRTGDFLALDEPPFDAVVCVFGLFFVPDMAAAARALWHLVRPSGVLAVTTWGPRFFEPASTAFWEAVREVRPDLHRSFNPWDRISEPDAVRALLAHGGAQQIETTADAGRHPIPTPEAWWAAVQGSGYRGTVDQLDAAAREHVRAANTAYILQSGLTEVEANVVYSRATKASQ